MTFWTIGRRGTFVLTMLVGVMPCLEACQKAASSASAPAAESPVDRGRYLVRFGSCNDCHTDGYAEKNGEMQESEWLTGSVVGLYGPWGTTYPPNLRLTVQQMDEDAFVRMLRTRTSAPPMVWPSVNHLSESDGRAIYAYIKWLGPKGKPAPAALLPGEVPTTPYVDNLPISGQPPKPAQ